MKFSGSIGIILALACLQGAVAQDTIWICREDTAEDYYLNMYLSDTFPDNRGQFTMVDTGNALEGKYVNFNYQFGNPNPGYAGFKFYWDNGICSFWVASYDSMILWHKGPLPGHKVMMIWASASAGCGSPILYEKMGEFMSSSVWKRESIPFPQKRGYGQFPDSPFVKNGLFELRMLVYNDSIGGDTSSTSAKGDLKIDNVYFLKTKAPKIQTQPHSQTVWVDSSVTFTVVATGATTYQWRKDGFDISSATSSSYTIASAQSSDEGSYAVVVTNSFGYVTSDAATLTVIGTPKTVTLVSPAAGATVQTDSVVLVWRKANPLVTKYQIQVATDSAMTFAFQDSTDTDTSKLLKSLSANQKYWWRVRACNATGWGNYSEINSFTYVPSAVIPRLTDMRTFVCSGSARVLRYSLPSPCRVSVRYYDIKGRLVASLVNRIQGAGDYSLTLPVSQWAGGAYVQVFEAGNYTVKRMITVVQ